MATGGVVVTSRPWRRSAPSPASCVSRMPGTETAGAWLASDRDPGELYRGGRLETAEGWAGLSGDDMNDVEREFLDAFAVIIESGYYLDQADFLELLQILQVQHQTELTGDRIKIFEFFSKTAELLEFDVELIKKLLSEPWEMQA